ncbi:hypothetical protein ACA910_002142 [Epithemia clementina (nom. ined.)]
MEISRLRVQVDLANSPGGDGKVDHKTLEQVAGFLNHVARAFPTIKLYLNGVYAMLNAWRPDQDKDGWKVGQYKVEYDPTDSPTRVRLVKRMNFDLGALERLTANSEPPEWVLRPSKYGSSPRYVFGDASGAGFGISKWGPGDTHIHVVHGAWNKSVSRGSSSNFRELANLVYEIERMNAAHELSDQVEIFIFTDNQHAESAFYRGTAKSPEVLELLFRLHMILIKGYAFVRRLGGWTTHDQPRDRRSVSCGSNQWSNEGLPMFDFIPLAKTALE